MGSGVLLAILVALWFVVLVPMVVTHGDLANAPAEPMRVLRRRSDRSPMSSGKGAMNSRGRQVPEVENMLTEPIPVLPRRTPGATLSAEQRQAPARPAATAVEERQVSTASADKPPRIEIDIRARRRRMLTGLVALAGLWAMFAALWQPILWWPQLILDLIVFSYLVFLRLEAQREQDRQERRRARDASQVRLPEDRKERVVRRHTQYQAHVTATTGNQRIALDDDDPSFAELPTWDPAARVAAHAPAWHERKAV